MLELHDLGFTYPQAERPALEGVNLTLQRGDCLGLLGSNGAGKTTLLSLIAGLLTPGRGEIRWQGERRLGLVPQQPALYAGLSVAENLALFADLYRLRGAERRDRLARVLAETRLEALRSRRAARLSGGQQRRLNMAIGLLRPASLYLFDEATVGVDAESRQHLLAAVTRLTDEGCAVIYTSHYLEEMERVAGRILLLDQGRVRMDLDKHRLLGAASGLLVEWADGPPAGLLERLRGLGLDPQPLPAGLQLADLELPMLARLCPLLAEYPAAPSLLRFGRPSLEQCYLSLTGGRL